MSGPYRGVNRYRTFLKAGRTIAGNISRLEGVIGILGTGSIGRRFADRFSDLDMTVYAREEAVARLRGLVSIGWISYRGVPYDIEVESYDRARSARVPSRFWTQVQRWHHQNSQILFEREGQLQGLLEEKLVYPDRERAELLKVYSNEVQEHLVYFPELWAERGRLYNVVDALTRGVHYLLLWIYARNRLFEPYMQKWPFYHMEAKAVPEYIHLPLLTGIYSGRIRSLSAAVKYRRELLDLCAEIGLEWEMTSTEEALEKCRRNWGGLSEESRRLLSW